MMRLVYMLLLTLCCMSVSCTHKELCYDHSHVVNLNVKFDWCNAPDASPASMSLYLFSEDGTRPQRYELKGHDGGTIRVSQGIYHAVCLNSDTRNIECRDKEHMSTFLVASRDETVTGSSMGMGMLLSTAMQNMGRGGERYARQPEMLWMGRGFDFVVGEDGGVVTLMPEQAVVRITISIYNVENMDNVTAVAGTLSGLSEGILASTGEPNGVGVTHPFEVTVSEDKSSLHASLLSFGDCLAGDQKHYIDLYTVLGDGSQWHYSFDVTEDVHEAVDELHIYIELDGLPVPEPSPGGGGGGFRPTIDEWTNVEQEIKM